MSEPPASAIAATRQRALTILQHYADQLIADAANAASPAELKQATAVVLSLLEKSRSLADSQTYARLLEHYCDSLRRHSHLGQLDALLATALKADDLTDVQRVLLSDIRAHILTQLGERLQAQHVIDDAKPHASSPALLARLLNREGYLYIGYKEHGRAKATYEKAIILAERAGDRHLVGIMYNNLGDMATSARDYEQARAYYEQALTLAHEEDDLSLCTLAESGLATSLERLGYLEEAVDHHLASRRCAEQTGDEIGALRANLNLGYNLYLRGQYQDLKALASAALAQARALGDLQRMAFAYHRLGQAYLGLHDYELACEHFAQALTIRRSIGKTLFIEASLDMFTALEDAIRADESLSSAQKESLLLCCNRARDDSDLEDPARLSLAPNDHHPPPPGSASPSSTTTEDEPATPAK